MRALILEDEAPAFRRLQNLLSEHHPYVEIVEVIDTVENAIKWLQNHKTPELIFSDIQLSDGLSFEIYKKLPPTCPIIFTTAFDEYMMEAFKTSGIDYLLKPIQIDELNRSIEKFRFLSNQNKEYHADLTSLIDYISPARKKYKKRFLVKLGTKLTPVVIKEIAYFYFNEGSTELHTVENKIYILDQSLDELENLIDPSQFFRLNRKCLANIDAIEKAHQFFKGKLKIELKPQSNFEVTVSREKASSFKSWLNGESLD